MQGQLAQANVSIDIEKVPGRGGPGPRRGRGGGHHAPPATPRPPGPTALGDATAAAEEALGLARAKGFEAQRQAIGSEQTALVAALREVGAGHVKIVPDIQVGGEGGVLGGLGAMLMRNLATNADGSPEGRSSDELGNGSARAVEAKTGDAAAQPAEPEPVES